MAGSAFDQEKPLFEVRSGQSRSVKNGIVSRIPRPDLGGYIDLSGNRKWYALGSAMVVWAALSYEKVPLAPQPIPVTPTQALSNLLRLPDRWIDNGDYNNRPHKSDNSAQQGPQATSVINVETTVASSATLPAFGSTVPESQVTTTTSGAAETATTLLPLVPSEVLPNPIQYSAAAGSVVCAGEVVQVQISENAGAPLQQLNNATGEDWTASSTGGANPLDEQLFREVLVSSGLDGSTIPAGDYTVYVRKDCTGLEQ